jgi:large subunit ribosomal protein L15
MPLIRRIPKRGFNNANFKIRFAIVNLDSLNAFESGSIVDEEALLKSGIIRRPYDAVKILGSGELNKKLTIKVHKASEAAKAAIEAAGGTLTVA